MKKLVLVMILLTMFGCGKDKKEDPPPQSNIPNVCPQPYRFDSRCWWSREIGCNVCRVFFSDGGYGTKCL